MTPHTQQASTSPDNADVVGAFMNPTIDPIIGLPNYERPNKIHMTLNQNATSIDSNLGYGQNGLLPRTISVAF